MNSILFVGEHPKTYDVRQHFHEHWELVYCTSGEGSFRLDNGAVIPYKTGDLVVIPPHVLHANTSTEGFTNIHITMADPSFVYHIPFRITDTENYFTSVFSQAKLFYMTDIKNREMVLAALGDLIIGYIVCYRSNSECSSPVEQIRNSIIHNYSDPGYALDEFIRSLPFNYDYLRKLFKKEIGMSPLEYLTSLRMSSAEKLLTAMWTNDYSITEIAQMCGYDDALYFSRVFKKHFGCAPTGFARRETQFSAFDTGRTETEKE